VSHLFLTPHAMQHEKVQFTFCPYFMLGSLSRYPAPVIQSAGLQTSSTHVVGRVQKYF